MNVLSWHKTMAKCILRIIPSIYSRTTSQT